MYEYVVEWILNLLSYWLEYKNNNRILLCFLFSIECALEEEEELSFLTLSSGSN